MPVKIDPAIVAELQEMDLVIWEAVHPKEPFFNEKTQKHSQRENKGWCMVSLAGPGVDEQRRASGHTLRAAVDAALAYHFPERLVGLRGALLKLDKEMLRLNTAVYGTRLKLTGELDDDDIPF
jgi:hypothetical protein